MLARRLGAPLDATLVREAALALEKQLLSLSAALLALCACVSCHWCALVCSWWKLLDAASLAWTTTIVRLWGHVLDATHFKASGLQRADRGLATGAWALDEHLDLLKT